MCVCVRHWPVLCAHPPCSSLAGTYMLMLVPLLLLPTQQKHILRLSGFGAKGNVFAVNAVCQIAVVCEQAHMPYRRNNPQKTVTGRTGTARRLCDCRASALQICVATVVHQNPDAHARHMILASTTSCPYLFILQRAVYHASRTTCRYLEEVANCVLLMMDVHRWWFTDRCSLSRSASVDIETEALTYIQHTQYTPRGEPRCISAAWHSCSSSLSPLTPWKQTHRSHFLSTT